MKVRRVDFSSGDWLGGTAGLSLEERGFYITACALIYTAESAIERNILRRACPADISLRTFNRLLKRLVSLGKLTVEDDLVDNHRCEKEIARARRRMGIVPTEAHHAEAIARSAGTETRAAEAHAEHAEATAEANTSEQEADEPSEKKALTPTKLGVQVGVGLAKNNDLDPSLQGTTKLPLKDKSFKGGLGRFAPLKVRDLQARETAIAGNKFRALVRSINQWAGEYLSGDAQWRAWEVLAAAESAGSRAALARRELKEFDTLDRMKRAHRAAA